MFAGRCWPDIAAAICRTKVSVTASDSFVTPHGRITAFSAVIRNRRCCWCSRTGVSLLAGTGELAGREAAKNCCGKNLSGQGIVDLSTIPDRQKEVIADERHHVSDDLVSQP